MSDSKEKCSGTYTLSGSQAVRFECELDNHSHMIPHQAFLSRKDGARVVVRWYRQSANAAWVEVDRNEQRREKHSLSYGEFYRGKEG